MNLNRAEIDRYLTREDEVYSDEQIERMDREADATENRYWDEVSVQYDRRVLRQALDLLSKLSHLYRDDGKIDPILDCLDGEVYDFLSANHPDYAPD